MPVRHVALAVCSVLVVGALVYLFMEVRASPAAPTAKPPARAADAARDDRDDEPETPSADKPYKPRTEGGGGLRGMARRAVANPQTSNDAGAAQVTPPSIPTEDGTVEKLSGPKLDAVMAEANKAYDKQDFEEARSIAQKVLKQHPTNVRMLRIMTSSYCIEVDPPEAQKYFNLLPGPDREQMKTRCARYGVTFTEPPPK